MIIAQVNASIRSSGTITATRMKELEQRDNLEQAFFRSTEIAGSWGKEEDYSEGRVSGSLAWRVSRGETGEVKKETEGGSNGNDDDDGDGGDGISSSTFYHVESFHPSPQYHNSNSSSSSSSSSNCLITVTAPPFPAPSSYPDCIRVSGVPCGAGLPKSISIVIIDEEHFCILQSRTFGDWRGAGRFLDTVPDGRVVALCAGVPLETNATTDDGRRTLRNTVSRVGGLDLSVVTKTDQQQDNKHLLCVGQMNTLPTWAMCIYEDGAGGKTVSVEIDVDIPRRELSKNPLKLRCEDDTVPQTVSMRLPEDVMPLQTQLTATEAEKKEGFLRYYKKCNHEYVGYCTKKEAPVYLIKKTAFPLRKNGSGGARAAVASSKRSSSWRTYHFLPEPLVPESIDSIECDTPPALFDIPFNESFYNNLLGPNLLKNDGGGQQEPLDTMSALSNCRLVALYFSAHWCPPCRKFTPILCEMYNHLKEIVPNHGLEIVFVSSDRDSGSFQQYFGTMPWLAVPLSNERKQRIGTQFGVQGIPALVVLDTISGEVVVSKEHSRGEVTNACRGGNVSIEKMLMDDWLKRIPPESQMIMETLALSCEPQINTNPKITPNSYLEKVHSSSNDTKTDVGDASVRIKAVFNELVENGLQPNAAAAQAINQVAEEQARASSEVKLIPSMLTGKVEITHGGMEQEFPRKVGNSNVAKTAKQYLNNVRKHPYTFRFRSFKMSNKIFDRITASTDGIEDVLNLGFSTYNNDTDFMACIPLGANLEGMNDTIEHFLSKEGAKEKSGESEA
eukprot:CAMPEP_0198259078 /NCGR_PEP_ID=MMETSP1447-20131203/8346_1 /TAXON_ID=420782 /ORGANISM="Chaetoceros dichaeta, Strain CCMP1751" /LENGTH=786 /DNA_ID=CAMNT_0043946359 /DNA_START=58 /DNA_END=2418 /DNA_ORIENTATION=+